MLGGKTEDTAALAFQGARAVNAVPHVVPPTVKLFLSLLHNCNIATIMDLNVKHLCFPMVLGTFREGARRHPPHPKGIVTRR